MNFESPSMLVQPLIYELNGTKIICSYQTWLNEISFYKKILLASLSQEFKEYLEVIWGVAMFHFLFIKKWPWFFFYITSFIIYWAPTMYQLHSKNAHITFLIKIVIEKLHSAWHLSSMDKQLKTAMSFQRWFLVFVYP